LIFRGGREGRVIKGGPSALKGAGTGRKIVNALEREVKERDTKKKRSYLEGKGGTMGAAAGRKTFLFSGEGTIIRVGGEVVPCGQERNVVTKKKVKKTVMKAFSSAKPRQ